MASKQQKRWIEGRSSRLSSAGPPVCSQYSSAMSEGQIGGCRIRRSDCFAPSVTVVETSDAWKTDNSRTRRGPRFHGATDRCIADRGMDSLRVVVIDVISE